MSNRTTTQSRSIHSNDLDSQLKNLRARCGFGSEMLLMARVLERNGPHGVLTEGEPSPSADPVALSTDVLTDSGRAISMRTRYTNG